MLCTYTYTHMHKHTHTHTQYAHIQVKNGVIDSRLKQGVELAWSRSKACLLLDVTVKSMSTPAFVKSDGSTGVVPVSGQGDVISSVSGDGMIKITSAVSAEVVLELHGHGRKVKCLAGEFLTRQMMQAHDGRKVKCLEVYTGGKRMAFGGEDGTVHLLDTSGESLQKVQMGQSYGMNGPATHHPRRVCLLPAWGLGH
jgi:WD40 repeat protein